VGLWSVAEKLVFSDEAEPEGDSHEHNETGCTVSGVVHSTPPHIVVSVWCGFFPDHTKFVGYY